MDTLNQYCKKTFGEKLYKLSLNGGMTCPNRDGTLGDRGCIFCSAGGSGDFAPAADLPLEEQIAQAKARIAPKFRGSRYIAYFQAYTNTYAPVERLKTLFEPVIHRPDIAALSIATRPDCLPEEVLDLLGELNHIKPVWVELGLQTIHPKTAAYIRRGYDLPCYDRAVRELNARGIHVVTHVILGLPWESRQQMLETVDYAAQIAAAPCAGGHRPGGGLSGREIHRHDLGGVCRPGFRLCPPPAGGHGAAPDDRRRPQTHPAGSPVERR